MLETELVFIERTSFNSEKEYLDRKLNLQHKVNEIYNENEETTKEMPQLPLRSDPVAGSLDATLKKTKHHSASLPRQKLCGKPLPQVFTNRNITLYLSKCR